MVIAVYARAKLLGIKILSLDARVAIAPDTARDLATVATRTRVISADAYLPQKHAGRRADLARAVQLLEEGTKSLDKARNSSRIPD